MSIGGELNRDRFVGVIGTQFMLITAEGKSIPIELVEVSDLRLLPNQASYHMHFSFPQAHPVQQGLYELR